MSSSWEKGRGRCMCAFSTLYLQAAVMHLKVFSVGAHKPCTKPAAHLVADQVAASLVHIR